MAEYIEREEIMNRLFTEYATDSKADVFELIRSIPAADVQPVRRGRWITKAKDYYKAWQDSGRSWDDMPYFITGKHIACSECFTEYDVCTEGIEHWIGCPCCLAKMDGDAE